MNKRILKRSVISIIVLCLILSPKLLFAQLEQQLITANFNTERGAIIIKSALSNEDSSFIIDTGVSIPIFDKSCKKIIMRSSEIAIEDENTNIIKNTNLNLPSLPVYQGDIVFSELSTLSKKMGIVISGILPIHFPGYEIYLDFGNEKIAWKLISPERKTPPDNLFCERIYFSPDHPAPQLSIILNNKVSLIADIDFTRSENVGLPMAIANKYKLSSGENKFAHFSNGKTVQYFRLHILRVGNKNFNNLLSVAVPGEKNIWLGNHFWRKFALSINYEEAKICFLKETNNSNETWTGTGILLDYLSEQGWIIGVVENSPAWNSGNLRGGEILQKINDIDVKNINGNQLLQWLNSNIGTEVRCSLITKDNSQEIITLVSEKIL